MKTIDLTKEEVSLMDVLALAKDDAVLVRTASGDSFLIEEAGEFEREATALGNSEKFMSFLNERAGETGDIAIREAAKKRGIGEL